MKKIDHIAIVVDDTIAAAEWYSENHGAKILYTDSSWSIVEFKNIKLAFVLSEQHPPHFAFEVKDLEEGNLHRDGSVSVYRQDPWGNSFELVKYPD